MLSSQGNEINYIVSSRNSGMTGRKMKRIRNKASPHAPSFDCLDIGTQVLVTSQIDPQTSRLQVFGSIERMEWPFIALPLYSLINAPMGVLGTDGCFELAGSQNGAEAAKSFLYTVAAYLSDALTGYKIRDISRGLDKIFEKSRSYDDGIKQIKLTLMDMLPCTQRVSELQFLPRYAECLTVEELGIRQLKDAKKIRGKKRAQGEMPVSIATAPEDISIMVRLFAFSCAVEKAKNVSIKFIWRDAVVCQRKLADMSGISSSSSSGKKPVNHAAFKIDITRGAPIDKAVLSVVLSAELKGGGRDIELAHKRLGLHYFLNSTNFVMEHVWDNFSMDECRVGTFQIISKAFGSNETICFRISELKCKALEKKDGSATFGGNAKSTKRGQGSDDGALPASALYGAKGLVPFLIVKWQGKELMKTDTSFGSEPIWALLEGNYVVGRLKLSEMDVDKLEIQVWSQPGEDETGVLEHFGSCFVSGAEIFEQLDARLQDHSQMKQQSSSWMPIYSTRDDEEESPSTGVKGDESALKGGKLIRQSTSDSIVSRSSNLEKNVRMIVGRVRFAGTVLKAGRMTPEDVRGEFKNYDLLNIQYDNTALTVKASGDGGGGGEEVAVKRCELGVLGIRNLIPGHMQKLFMANQNQEGCDAYCSIYFNGEPVGSTSTIRNRCDFVWEDELFTIKVPKSTDLGHSLLSVEVWTPQALGGKAVELCRCEITGPGLVKLIAGTRPREQWIDLLSIIPQIGIQDMEEKGFAASNYGNLNLRTVKKEFDKFGKVFKAITPIVGEIRLFGRPMTTEEDQLKVAPAEDRCV
jgi:hypothetical protein